jgi:hypothetical protein
MQCARHPNTETQLSCGRCETPVCPKCLVHAEVGIRCQTCAPRRRQILGSRGLLGGGGTVLAIIVVAAIAVLLLGGGNGGSGRGFGGFPDDRPEELRPEVLQFAGIGERSQGSPAALRLSGYACARIEAFEAMACEGSVQNISGEPLSGVQVVVEWLTGAGDVSAVNRESVPYNPILPNQTSPWTLQQPSYNPEFQSYRLSFETASGPLIVEDVAQPPQ